LSLIVVALGLCYAKADSQWNKAGVGRDSFRGW